MKKEKEETNIKNSSLITHRSSLLIKGGRVIDPSSNLDEITDILIENGKITKIGKIQDSTLKQVQGKTQSSGLRDLDVIDAKGKVVVPGLIDMHVHLREPGYEYKETIKTGTEAARAGGFTVVCCMPNTNPVNDSRSVTEFILDRTIKEGSTDVYPIGAISKGLKGEELSEMADLVEAGCVAFSDDGKSVMDSELMRRAMEYAIALGVPIISHCEDTNLSKGGVMNEGFVSTELGLQGIPDSAEEVIISRDLLLAEITGVKLHIAHVSTKGSVRLIKEAKERGIGVTAETCPHYFLLTDNEVRGYDSDAKVNPPLRTEEDIEAIKQGLKDGTIDVIATDHAPHNIAEKLVEFDYAPFGIVGLETALSLSLKLVEWGVLTINELIEKMTANPARILGLKKGILNVGSDADVTIIDMNQKVTVDPMKFRSKGRNTPFKGAKLKGLPIITILRGKT
ncbi:MAG: dihydroorotase [Nitrospirae bacterium]|nr:dihydroorotase [Nitrospirota bacterium]